MVRGEGVSTFKSRDNRAYYCKGHIVLDWVGLNWPLIMLCFDDINK